MRNSLFLPLNLIQAVFIFIHNDSKIWNYLIFCSFVLYSIIIIILSIKIQYCIIIEKHLQTATCAGPVNDCIIIQIYRALKTADINRIFYSRPLNFYLRVQVHYCPKPYFSLKVCFSSQVIQNWPAAIVLPLFTDLFCQHCIIAPSYPSTVRFLFS